VVAAGRWVVVAAGRWVVVAVVVVSHHRRLGAVVEEV
jgi:hypothetical protein